MQKKPLTRVVVVEDHDPTRSKIISFVNGSNLASVCAEANSVDVAMEVIAATKPDVLILDVQLGNQTCFDLLPMLEPCNYGIIFLTSYDEYAIRAIKHGALDYLLKPVDEAELMQALKKAGTAAPVAGLQVAAAAKTFQEHGTAEFIAVNDGAIWHMVETKTIVYATSVNGNRILLADNEVIEMSKSISELEEICPEPLFIRPHVSYLVNKRHIKQYNDKTLQIILKDGSVIPVSSRVKSEMLRRLITS